MRLTPRCPVILSFCLAVAFASSPVVAAPDKVPIGDFNENGKLDANDIDQLSEHVRSGDFNSTFDLNDDQVLDQEDRRIWVEDLAQTYFGDTNLNGVFNTGDLVHVFKSGEYEDQLLTNSTWETGDWDGNGEFESGDLVISFQGAAFEGPPRLPLNPGPKSVPEPATAALATFAGLALILARRIRG